MQIVRPKPACRKCGSPVEPLKRCPKCGRRSFLSLFGFTPGARY